MGYCACGRRLSVHTNAGRAGRRRDRRRRFSELDELAREVDEYLADLSYLVDREPVVREYETVPLEPDDGGRLPIYELAPERIRRRSEQEVQELREKARAGAG